MRVYAVLLTAQRTLTLTLTLSLSLSLSPSLSLPLSLTLTPTLTLTPNQVLLTAQAPLLYGIRQVMGWG